MADADYLSLGDWNIHCSMCGAKMKASEAVKNWQGMWRHPKCNEPRQPQDFVRAVPDVQTPPWTQIAGQSFVLVCAPNDQTAYPRRAIPGCVLPGFVSSIYDPTQALLD